jgi:hypothetical protein
MSPSGKDGTQDRSRERANSHGEDERQKEEEGIMCRIVRRRTLSNTNSGVEPENTARLAFCNSG